MNAPVLALSFRLGIRKGFAEPAFTLGALVIFFALVVSYGQLLKALPAEAMARLQLDHGQLVWYLIVTEMTIMGTSWRFREVQDEVNSGAMEIMLLRPVAFWPVKLAGWTGEQLVKLGLMLPAGLATGMVLTGSIPVRPALLLLAPCYFMAFLMIMASYMLCGCASLWLKESRPVFFLYQKFIFLLGGLLWPLAFYPAWLQHVAWFTPFPAMVATVGEFMLGLRGADLAFRLGLQLCWLALMLGLCALMAAAMRRRFLSNGGS